MVSWPSIVGHGPFGADAALPELSERAYHDPCRCPAPLVDQHFDAGKARRIVDLDIREILPGATVATLAAPVGHVVAEVGRPVLCRRSERSPAVCGELGDASAVCRRSSRGP